MALLDPVLGVFEAVHDLCLGASGLRVVIVLPAKLKTVTHIVMVTVTNRMITVTVTNDNHSHVSRSRMMTKLEVTVTNDDHSHSRLHFKTGSELRMRVGVERS